MQSAEKPNRLTVKQAAKLMHVSERSVYYARKIRRYAPILCPEADLVTEMEKGRMKLGKAMRILEAKAAEILLAEEKKRKKRAAP